MKCTTYGLPLLFIPPLSQAVLRGTNACRQVADILTGAGTSLPGPQLNLFPVAEPSVYPHHAESMVYKLNNTYHEMDNKRTSKNR